MTRKKILMILPNLYPGGAEYSFSKLSHELALNHEVYVVIFSIHTEAPFTFGGQVTDLDIKGGKNFFDKAVKFYERVNRIKEIKRRHKIDISISFLEGADYVNILSKEQDKVVLSVRGSKVSDQEIVGFLGFVRKELLIPRLYAKADFIVTISEGLKKELRQHFGLTNIPIQTVYNFFDINQITERSDEPLDIKYNKIFRGKVIINIGRLHIQKEQKLLLKILAQIPRPVRPKLVILGAGPLLTELVEEAQTLDLKYYVWYQERDISDADEVFFLGFQDNPYQFLKHSSLFVFTSLWEGFGNAIAEAMICGLPVVSADCPSGPREILAPETEPNPQLATPETAEFGVLMPLLKPDTESVSVWADFLNNFLNNPDLMQHYRQKARQRVLDFSREKAVGAWLEVIDSLVK